MYEVTSIPLVKRTRATLRRAEFGFLGVVVYTRVQTPRFCGLCWSAGLFVRTFRSVRPLRTSCEIVGIRCFPFHKRAVFFLKRRKEFLLKKARHSSDRARPVKHYPYPGGFSRQGAHPQEANLPFLF